MTDYPLVSIITVVFNGGRHLQQTIDSVANQTYGNIEYIIIDGGSTDNTLAIIEKNETRISKWISEPDKGISDAFNKGINLSSGEIVGLVNADDWLELETVKHVVQQFGNADILYGEVQFWYNEKPFGKTKSNHARLRAGMTLAHPACFIRRKIYENFGGFSIDYKVAMDYDLLLRFYHKGIKFSKVNAVFTNMRNEGVSDTRWLLGIKEEIKIKNEYYSTVGNWYHFFKQYSIFAIKRWLRKFYTHT